MPRFAANLSMLFRELEFPARFAAAAGAGFRAVECQFPYAFGLPDLRSRLDAHGLKMVLINLPPGDWAAGERGIACHPARREEFRAGVEEGIRYSAALGCARVNCLAGIPIPGMSPDRAREALVENLRFAAERLAGEGIGLLIEPINTRDVPGFVLCRTQQAHTLIEEVGSRNLRLQYDAYHMHIMEGDLCAGLERHRDILGHVQIADAPGRHEPGTGGIDFPAVFECLDRIGYRGWIGCEYVPLGGTAAGLGWMERYR